MEVLAESVLYDLWEQCAFTGMTLQCTGGERLTVLAKWERNRNSGPDFVGAVLLIDGVVRVGAVEMHLSERDWFVHGHDSDPAYGSVILHVLGAAPIAPRLDLPTVVVPQLTETSGAEPACLAGPPYPDLGAELLAELSWARLLRRATRMLRELPAVPDNASLRRTFILELFDVLGYATNRQPMGKVARSVLQREHELEKMGFDEVAALVFAVAGMPVRRVVSAGTHFVSETRLRSIVHSLTHGATARRPGAETEPVGRWDYSVRLTAVPERRLWGSVKLLIDLYRSRLLPRLLDRIAGEGGVEALAGMLVVRMGTESYIGIERAREIVINALLPLAVAAGAATGRTSLLTGACRAYREAPSLASNRIIRAVERRWLGGSELAGAFWQQGAIELYQRFLAADRSGLSFVAEPVTHAITASDHAPVRSVTTEYCVPSVSKSSAVEFHDNL
jgi:hypothetical protein